MRREILASLAAVESRLRADGGASCPCAVAEAGDVPRFVKVLASHHVCGCGGADHARHGAARLASDLDEAGSQLVGLA
jgi:hypothetical protein